LGILGHNTLHGQYFICSFLFSAYPRTDLLRRIIGRRIVGWISWIGKISFSLYLVHFPLFKLFGYLHRDFLGRETCQFLSTPALFDSCNLYGVALLSVVRKSNSSVVKKENEPALSNENKVCGFSSHRKHLRPGPVGRAPKKSAASKVLHYDWLWLQLKPFSQSIEVKKENTLFPTVKFPDNGYPNL
jgi:hypothetical protein